MPGRRRSTVRIFPSVAHRIVARDIFVRVSGKATEENIRRMVVLLEMARETAAAIWLGARRQKGCDRQPHDYRTPRSRRTVTTLDRSVERVPIDADYLSDITVHDPLYCGLRTPVISVASSDRASSNWSRVTSR